MAETGRSVDAAIREWKSKSRRMGCVSAAAWFCKRVPDFYPIRLVRNGEPYWEHVVATDGTVVVDLTPHLDDPEP